MIVKTGANYQAEGGYIEASAKGHVYTLKSDNKSVTFGGSDETELAIVPITIINELGRDLLPTCIFKMGSEDVLGTPTSSIVATNTTATIKCLGIVGLKQRFSYTGAAVNVLCESEYIELVNSGAYSYFTIVKLPENGEPITMRVYQ